MSDWSGIVEQAEQPPSDDVVSNAPVGFMENEGDRT
jgi:hypothetical protein